VADRLAADVGLGELVDLDGALHPGRHADLLERVLQGQGVDDRGEHAHVVGGDAADRLAAVLLAAPDVAAADDDADLQSLRVGELDLGR
jgi:hypothetical protein